MDDDCGLHDTLASTKRKREHLLGQKTGSLETWPKFDDVFLLLSDLGFLVVKIRRLGVLHKGQNLVIQLSWIKEYKCLMLVLFSSHSLQ